MLADETEDSSHKEQLSIVLQYVDNKNDIVEQCVGFVHAQEGTTGEALAGCIMSFITNMGLDMQNC